MPTSSEPYGKYVPQYTLTEHSRGVPRWPTQVNADVENLIEISTANSEEENKTLRIVGEVLAGLILLFLLITAIVVPLVVNMNSSKDTAAATNVTTTTVTTVTTSTSTTTTTSTATTSTTSTSTTTSTTTTQNPYACSNMTVLTGYDLPGDDIISYVLGNYTLCCQLCQNYTGCMAYTWGLPTAGSNVNRCFLKYGVPASSANVVLVSAYF